MFWTRCCRGVNPIGVNLNDNYMTREIIHSSIPFNLRARGRILLKAGKVIVIAVLGRANVPEDRLFWVMGGLRQNARNGTQSNTFAVRGRLGELGERMIR